MTALWIASALMTVAVLAVMVLPLLRGRKASDAPDRAAFDLTVYKDQLAEVDSDMERGILSDDQALAARTEIERRMLAAASEDAEEDAAAKTHDNPSDRFATKALAVVVLVTVPLGAFGLYMSLGEPTLRDFPLAERTQQGGTQHAGRSQPADTRAAQMNALIDQAKTALDKNPQDTRSWSMLGQIYQMQGQLPEAIDAFENLVKYSDNHPEALIALAETHFMNDGEVVSEVARDLFAQAKIQAPANPITYYYLALYHQGKANFQGAVNEYAGLLSVSPSNAEWVADIEDRMQIAAAEGGLEVPVVEMLAPIEKAPEAVGPTAEQVQQAQEMNADDQQAMIRSMVERLAGKLQDNPDDLAGWKRLAQAYAVLGNKEGLAEAQAQIKRLEGK